MSFKLLQYGESGSGKSVRAAKFAKYGPLYLFDFDNKFISSEIFLKAKAPDLLKNITAESFRGLDPDDFMGRVNAKLKSVVAEGYATIVFDSWTQFERVYFEYLMSHFQSLGGKNWGESRQTITLSKDEVAILPGTNDYILKNREIARFVDKITALPINVIVNCHVKEVMKGAATIAAEGQSAKILPKSFHEFVYLYNNAQGVNKVRVKPTSEFLANSPRTDVGPSGILDKDDFSFYDAVVFRGGK